MDTNALKKFAQTARRDLLAQVEARLVQVLSTDSVELREKLGVVNELRTQVEQKGKVHLVEEAAYTWFNRLCALRYMDVNQITKVGVVSPIPGFTQPEILQDAKQGSFDKDLRLDQGRVQGLLNGTIPASNPEQEAYRLLLVAVCNRYAEQMDFLFPIIEDYTELLMPEDLLSTQSVLHAVREALTQETCQDVEVIGWLYQFYISEKKDEVMARKGAVPKEDIPSVTQLFTPHWIVRYMVENSLGRLWLLNYPESKIREMMEFYIDPALTPTPSPAKKGSVSLQQKVRDQGVRKTRLSKEMLQVCRELRKQATDAEQLLWGCLRNRNLGGFKFRRQHPIQPYILDFYCHEARLCVELDGSGHIEPDQQAHDEARTRYLEAQGIHVIRFWNHEVTNDLEVVLESILEACEVRIGNSLSSPHLNSPHLNPLPEGEEVKSSDGKSHLSVGEDVKSSDGKSHLSVGEEVKSGEGKSPVPVGEEVKSGEVKSPVPVGEEDKSSENKSPLPVEEDVKSPLLPGDDVKSPLPPGDNVKSPLLPGDDVKSPLPPGDNVKSPLSVGEDVKSPLPPGEGQGEGSFLKITSPEELKILDPACGSGHILTYAFDLLYAIYEELGYDPVSIPRLILEKNLYGIEIDKRAAMLSSFALMMKAVEKDKRFFRRKAKPNILEMEDVAFEPQEIKNYMAKVGEDLWTQELWEGLRQFEDANTFGSLIRPALKDVPELRARLENRGVFEDLFLAKTNEKVQQVLLMSEYLSPRYQVVVANPPYFSKGMDADYKQFAGDHYPDFKTDSFSMFVKRNNDMAVRGGQIGLMTPFVWMFIASYEKMRHFLIDQQTITTLIQLEYSGFEGATVPICTFTLANEHHPNYKGGYIRLSDFRGAENQAPMTREAIANPDCGWFFRASAADFKKIPGAPIAYWVKETNNFLASPLSITFISGGRNKTHDNNKYVRNKWEVSLKSNRWVGYCNGGDFRKWYGNEYYVVDWSKEAKEYYDSHGGLINKKFWDKEGITWSLITSAKSSFRIKLKENVFSSGSPTIFNSQYKCDSYVLSFLNSPVSHYYLKAINPTLNTTVGNVLSLPLIKSHETEKIKENTNQLIDLSENDYNSFEISTSFNQSPLFTNIKLPINKLISFSFRELLMNWQQIVLRAKKLEEENNKTFIRIYNLDDVLSSILPFEEITLTCNPYYRYGNYYSEDELVARLLADSVKEFLSYAVGCAFGRYSLDKPGLVLANQGETVADYYKALTPHLAPCGSGDESLRPLGEGQDEGQQLHVTYAPTETNVIPIVEGEWFPDGAAAQFKQFLRVTFGEENFAENLRFIEDALGKDIEKYFFRDFYKDHLQMYKKRPIYWLFSSPKGSFNALIYMHRYNRDTVSVVLNQYLREFREKLSAHHRHLKRISDSAGLSTRARNQALKESEKTAAILAELTGYEDDMLFPLASQRIEIDLDDGVVVNYAKFGEALKKI